MRLSTSVSDQAFLALFLVFLLAGASLFYVVVEQAAEERDRESKSGLLDNLKVHAGPLDFITLGSSHANKFYIHNGLRFINLAEAWTIPTVMYFKAKWILREHPEVRVVYLEADEQHFFDGPIFDLAALTPVQRRNHPIFQWGQAFFDEEERAVFGEVAPYSQNHWLLLEPDVKPIILKRMMASIWRDRANREKSLIPSSRSAKACDLGVYPERPVINGPGAWASRTPRDQARRIAVRLSDAEFGLDKPHPLSALQTTYYEKTIRLLQAAGIQVVLVRYPRVPAYDAAIHPAIHAMHEQYLKDIEMRYGLDVLDLRALGQYGENIFEDQDHLAEPYWWLIGRELAADFCRRFPANDGQ